MQTYLSTITNFSHCYGGLYLNLIQNENLLTKYYTLSPFCHFFLFFKYISEEINYIDVQFEPCFFL